MRNLLEYPVTTEEIVTLLENIKYAHMSENKDVIGDMTPVIIEEAIKRICTDTTGRIRDLEVTVLALLRDHDRLEMNTTAIEPTSAMEVKEARLLMGQT